MSLTVEVRGRDFGTVFAPGVELAVDWLRWEAVGGPASGVLSPSGGGLADCLDWLRRPVVVRSAGQQPIWWGYIWSVAVPIGGYMVGASMEGVANRVRVRYTDTTPAEAVTGWADDVQSQTTFGVIEYEEEMKQEQATSTEAEQRRDRILSDLAWPMPMLYPNQQIPEIVLRGWWSTLGWQYWTQASTGGVENTTQITTIATAEGEFISGVDVVDSSGVSGEQERDGTQSALDNIAELLATGTTNDRRLLATVTVERLLRVYEEPARTATAEYNLHVDGSMSYGRTRAPLLPGFAPAGVWAALADLPVHLTRGGLVSRLSPVFVEANEWRDGVLSPEPRDIRSAWDVLG